MTLNMGKCSFSYKSSARSQTKWVNTRDSFKSFLMACGQHGAISIRLNLQVKGAKLYHRTTFKTNQTSTDISTCETQQLKQFK